MTSLTFEGKLLSKPKLVVANPDTCADHVVLIGYNNDKNTINMKKTDIGDIIESWGITKITVSYLH
jgi:hypothetical protein